MPPRTHGINPRDLKQVKFVRPKVDKINSESCICSTLYNPVNTEFPDSSLMEGLQQFSLLNNTCQIGQVIPDNFENIETKVTTFGPVYVGSTLSHQLPMPKSDGSIVKIKNAPEFPCLPLLTHNLTSPVSLPLLRNESIFMEGLDLTIAQCHDIEGTTRSQSDCPEWHKLRQSRITSSVFKDVISRKKDFESLANKFLVNKRIVTPAMKHGITNEANAVLEYATHKNVNVKPCGFLINPQAVYLGTTPDRLVYDPNEVNSFGVLEVKCPMKSTFKDVPYLKQVNSGFKLRESHAYYMQVMGQMALSIQIVASGFGSILSSSQQ